MEERYARAPATALAPSGELEYHERCYIAGTYCLDRGDLDAALSVFSEYLIFTDQAHLVDPEAAAYELKDVASYGDFENRFRELLDRKFRSWTMQREPLPRFIEHLERTRPPLVSPSGKKVLFLLPKYILNSKRFVEADLRDHLLESAANAGAIVDFFSTDRCAYPDLHLDSSVAASELDALKSRIIAFQPDVVVLDANYVPAANSLGPAFLRELKTTLDFKVVAFIGDAWGEHWVPAADKWSEIADIIFHFAPDTPIEKKGQHPEKLCWDAYPVNRRNFFPGKRKKYDISFIGTYVSQLRPFWLTVALQIAMSQKLKHRLLPHKREKGQALSMKRYAAIVRRSKMVLNFSTRWGTRKMMTGRTWQALQSGAILLEEDNDFTSAYFSPFVHYVPFSTRKELECAIRFISANPDYAARMSAAAVDLCRKYYSAEAIWSRVLGAAYATNVQPVESRTTMLKRGSA